MNNSRNSNRNKQDKKKKYELVSLNGHTDMNLFIRLLSNIISLLPSFGTLNYTDYIKSSNFTYTKNKLVDV